MHVEIQVALNFLISFLYNKLPRRRVNNFGEELEAALKVKFEGHWYPDKPFKGSAFRCLKTATPLDPVFEIAAREAGMDVCDIQENLPQELSIWIDPGEVSYRMSEKGPVKILYSESDGPVDSSAPDREVAPTFNPEAQSFKPIDSIANQLSSMSIGPLGGSSAMAGTPQAVNPSFPVSPLPGGLNSFKTPSLTSGFGPRGNNNVTYTAAAFAQTKFGSTKLKTNSKRSQRMSPTEFGNYIKNKQQMMQLSSNGTLDLNYPPLGAVPARSLSPDDSSVDFMYQGMCPSPPGQASFPFGNPFALDPPSPFDASRNLEDLFGPTVGLKNGLESHRRPSVTSGHQENPLSRFSSFMDKAGPFVTSPSSSVSSGTSVSQEGTNGQSSPPNRSGYESLSYQNQYQHLLLAN